MWRSIIHAGIGSIQVLASPLCTSVNFAAVCKCYEVMCTTCRNRALVTGHSTCCPLITNFK